MELGINDLHWAELPSSAVASRLNALSAVQNQLYLIDKYKGVMVARDGFVQ